MLEGVFAELSRELQRALNRLGHNQPTPIQEQAIPHLLAGRDLMGCAQTGTGKTAAFCLPILQHLQSVRERPSPASPRVLVLAPTRELASQIGDSVADYGRFLRATHITIYGGVGQGPQVNALRRGVDIAIATPGRLLDLHRQGEISFDHVGCFVLDEADRMLDMGFLPDIRRVLRALPGNRQSLLFSATFPPDIVELSSVLVRDPVRITVSPQQPAVERITQKVLFVEKQDKALLLADLLRDPGKRRVLVFAEMKHMADRVAKTLSASGIAADTIHGNKSQNARMRALSHFRSGKARVLVATDVAARGLDVNDISHVINYDLPREAETYIHRIGRTARAGAQGDAVSFCCGEERGLLRGIERLLRHPVPVDTDHARHSETARCGTHAVRTRQRAGRPGHHRMGRRG